MVNITEGTANAISASETLTNFPPALLEDWYRYNYFGNEFDISGSGVEDYTFSEIQQIADFTFSEVDQLTAEDGYTVGNANVRSQIAKRFGNGDSESVLTTNGANEGLLLVMRALLKAGDELVTLGPCYHCHDQIAASMGCVIKKWAIPVGESQETLDVNDLKSLITSKTQAICLNFPHNPTGISIDQATLNEIVRLSSEHNIYLIWDAVFQELVYDTVKLDDPIHHYDKTVTLGTFSKAYGAPGLRFGWVIGPNNLIASCIRQKDYGNLFVAPLLEFVAEKMLMKLDDFSKPRLDQARRNRTMVSDWAQNPSLDVSWRPPDGGVCGILKLPENTCDFIFCTQLLEKTGVLLVPGSCFSIPGYARLGFGGNEENLQTGLDRLSQFLLGADIS